MLYNLKPPEYQKITHLWRNQWILFPHQGTSLHIPSTCHHHLAVQLAGLVMVSGSELGSRLMMRSMAKYSTKKRQSNFKAMPVLSKGLQPAGKFWFLLTFRNKKTLGDFPWLSYRLDRFLLSRQIEKTIPQKGHHQWVSRWYNHCPSQKDGARKVLAKKVGRFQVVFSYPLAMISSKKYNNPLELQVSNHSCNPVATWKFHPQNRWLKLKRFFPPHRKGCGEWHARCGRPQRHNGKLDHLRNGQTKHGSWRWLNYWFQDHTSWQLVTSVI